MREIPWHNPRCHHTKRGEIPLWGMPHWNKRIKRFGTVTLTDGDEMMECEHYQPDPERPGKNRPYCKYWSKADNGVCNSQKQFMCIYFIEKWLKEHPIDTKN